MISIRPIHEEDTADFLALCRQLDQESHFMLLEPDERTQTEDEQRERIRQIIKAANQQIFLAVAVEKGEIKLVGYLSAQGGAYRRNWHTVHLVIGILQAYTGQGIGTRLFEMMEAWARGWGARRLELTVMTHNRRGVALYRKMGFEIEATQRDSLYVDGTFVDQYAMSKILKAAA